MHPQKLIDTVIQFEKDLAAFYGQLAKKKRFQKLHNVLQFMHQHSEIHAELIRNFRSEASLPGLDITPLEALHGKIKSALTDQLTAAENMDEVFESLAQAEAIIGQMYHTISEHYQRMSDVYALLSQKFKNLSADEMQHHDHIQNEKAQFHKAEPSHNDGGGTEHKDTP